MVVTDIRVASESRSWQVVVVVLCRVLHKFLTPACRFRGIFLRERKSLIDMTGMPIQSYGRHVLQLGIEQVIVSS